MGEPDLPSLARDYLGALVDDASAGQAIHPPIVRPPGSATPMPSSACCSGASGARGLREGPAAGIRLRCAPQRHQSADAQHRPEHDPGGDRPSGGVVRLATLDEHSHPVNFRPSCRWRRHGRRAGSCFAPVSCVGRRLPCDAFSLGQDRNEQQHHAEPCAGREGTLGRSVTSRGVMNQPRKQQLRDGRDAAAFERMGGFSG